MSSNASLRVLLVEDSSLLAARLSELIRRLPDVDLIDTVQTESDAVARIGNAVPDVLILDLHLRSGSGFGVLRSLAVEKALLRPKIREASGKKGAACVPTTIRDQYVSHLRCSES